jgi:regulator of replication initiation timing
MSMEFWKDGNLMALVYGEIVARHDADMAALAAERDALQSRNDNQKQQLMDLDRQISPLMSEVSALRDEIKQLKLENGNLPEIRAKFEQDFAAVLARAEKAEAELEARQSVPVKVRFDITTSEFNRYFSERDRGLFDPEVIPLICDYLAAHAVIDVPPGVPSAEELARAGKPIGELRWTNDRAEFIPAPGMRVDLWMDGKRLVPEAEPAETLEQLAEIHYEEWAKHVGDETAWNDLAEYNKDIERTQVLAILRAARPVLDVTPAHYTVPGNCSTVSLNKNDIDYLNSRIRYTVGELPCPRCEQYERQINCIMAVCDPPPAVYMKRNES